MRSATLDALLNARAQSEAVVLVTDLETGEQDLLRPFPARGAAREKIAKELASSLGLGFLPRERKIATCTARRELQRFRLPLEEGRKFPRGAHAKRSEKGGPETPFFVAKTMRARCGERGEKKHQNGGSLCFN